MKSKENFIIRSLKQEDAEFLCAIFKDNTEYYEIFYDSETNVCEWEERVGLFINQNRIFHYVIEDENNGVGWFSYLDISSTEREIGILVIKKEYLHCGYGAKTLLWFIEKCKEENVEKIILNVNQSNTRAIKFYKNFGFEIYAEEIIPQCNEAINLAQYKMQLYVK